VGLDLAVPKMVSREDDPPPPLDPVPQATPASTSPVAEDHLAQFPTVTEAVEVARVDEALMVWFGQVPVMLPMLVPATRPGEDNPVPPFATGRIEDLLK